MCQRNITIANVYRVSVVGRRRRKTMCPDKKKENSRRVDRPPIHFNVLFHSVISKLLSFCFVLIVHRVRTSRFSSRFHDWLYAIENFFFTCYSCNSIVPKHFIVYSAVPSFFFNYFSNFKRY